ncbi:unnamed protein product [Schistosoma bovis]|nr:unnamed protein product [Schistosoma bovis]
MYNIIFVYLAVSFALINAAVGNSFGNDPFKTKVINELKDYRVQKIIEDVIKNVEDSTTNIREVVKVLKDKRKNLRENLVEKRRTIEQYMKCKSKQRRAESFNGFLKEIEESLAFTMLTTYIKELDDLIAKKYMNMKSFNNGLFMYELAARNVDELIPLAKKIGAFL